jgi:hypothetical protein
MDVNVRAGVEFLRRVGVEGVIGEKDSIFEEKIDSWEELEVVIEKQIWEDAHT